MVRWSFARLSLLGALFVLGSALSTPSRADYVGYFPNGDESREIDFGGGQDGAFADGPTQAGITVVGATITFNTDVKDEFRFSSFQLTGGNTIVATGTRPLVIRVAGSATIAGTLSANGSAGGNAPTITGGTAGAGGGSGGNGGQKALGPSATDGAEASAFSDAGLAAANPAGQGAQPAGSGGCYGTSGAGAQDMAVSGSNHPGSAGACTTSRATVAQGFDGIFDGGAGGSGGASWADVSSDADGGGGGGSGGAIRLAVQGDLAISGSMTATGGAGGSGANSGGADCGAGGGGGSGGAIWIQVGGTFSGAGPLNASGGTGGASPCGYNGGAGSRGVIRIDAATDSFTGAINPAGADQTFGITRLPVITQFEMEGSGLVCSRALDSRDSSANAFFDFALIFGIAGIAVALGKRRKARS